METFWMVVVGILLAGSIFFMGVCIYYLEKMTKVFSMMLSFLQMGMGGQSQNAV